MTYGFDQVGDAGQAPVVPEGAETLLVTAFPELDDEQRRAVPAATQIDSGYPLDSTSEGWQRINLPAALSSTVVLDSAGTVIWVEPGQSTASVVVLDVIVPTSPVFPGPIDLPKFPEPCVPSAWTTGVWGAPSWVTDAKECVSASTGDGAAWIRQLAGQS